MWSSCRAPILPNWRSELSSKLTSSKPNASSSHAKCCLIASIRKVNQPRPLFLAGPSSAKRIGPIEARQRNGAAGARALKDPFDDALVLQAFFACRVGLPIVDHAVSHVIDLVGELIGLADHGQRRLVWFGEHFQAVIREGWVHPERAALGHHPIRLRFVGIEAAHAIG